MTTTSPTALIPDDYMKFGIFLAPFHQVEENPTQALERDNAVAYLRDVMGATDVAKAADGTVRKLYGTSIERNAIHGSDSPENAQKELAFFFSAADLIAAR